MHMDRAYQFNDRLGWKVDLRKDGREYDQYDQLNPLYVIVEDAFGTHAGSMRFLPTTGRTMVNEHFRHLLDGVVISNPLIWECTRFCISRKANRFVAPQLLAAGAKLMWESGIKHIIGVFDIRMLKVYKRLRASPTVICSSVKSKDAIAAGLWEFDTALFNILCESGGLSPTILNQEFEASPLGEKLKQARN